MFTCLLKISRLFAFSTSVGILFKSWLHLYETVSTPYKTLFGFSKKLIISDNMSGYEGLWNLKISFIISGL